VEGFGAGRAGGGVSALGQDALRAAVLKTLADDVGDAITATKDGIRDALAEGDIERLAVRLPDGRKVATIPLCGGEESPRITDPAAFLAWVKQAHPTEIEETVREGYRRKLLDDAKKAGRPVDKVTGKTIPGITFEPTTAYVKVDFIDGDIAGREHIRRAWRDGAISLPDVLALPAAPAGGEPS
jgi:hypothetical protein